MAGLEDSVPRHPLEIEALTEPRKVLATLPAELAAARQDGDHRRIALLHLAEANACRVTADWNCQQRAGSDAHRAARVAGDLVLEVRGLIIDSVGRVKMQDYAVGERLLAEAEQTLQKSPMPELSADILLNYSSLSQYLGKHQLAVEYAERGLAELSGDHGLGMQIRLLRNLARARAELGDTDAARAALARAEAGIDRIGDPKLSAEILLEAARLARAQDDFVSHDRYAARVKELGERLHNRHITARAREAHALARVQQGQPAQAREDLRQAHADLQELGLARDERRVLGQLVRVEAALGLPSQHMLPLIERLFDLEANLDEADRAQASDDFDTRLKYAEQKAQLEQMQIESELAREREASLARVNRLTLALAALVALVLLVLAAFFLQQWRSTRALRGAYARLHASQSQTQDLLRLNAAYVFLVDPEGLILQANPATAFALGRSPKQMVGSNLGDFLAGDGARVLADYLQRLQDTRQDESVLAVRDSQGRERQWRVASRLSPQQDGTRYIVASGVDVTEQVQQTEVLREQSLHDALTGCYNRRYLDGFERRHYAVRWGAVTIDLDRFKQINDEQGHERGDQVLQEMARFLSERVRAEDAVVRLGGDEFVLLIGHAEDAWVARLLERLRLDREVAPCGFSLGAELRRDGETLAQTLARADAAMYRAKGERRRA